MTVGMATEPLSAPNETPYKEPRLILEIRYSASKRDPTRSLRLITHMHPSKEGRLPPYILAGELGLLRSS